MQRFSALKQTIIDHKNSSFKLPQTELTKEVEQKSYKQMGRFAILKDQPTMRKNDSFKSGGGGDISLSKNTSQMDESLQNLPVKFSNNLKRAY